MRGSEYEHSPMKRRLDYTLYLVTDSNLAGGRELESIVRQAVRGGVTVVQLREKDLSSRDFFCLALQLRAVTDSLGIPLIINDRPDIARASGAAGVHLGQDDLPCRVVRSIVGPDMVIGVSVSTVEEATEAEADGADYLGVSPIFQTATKTDTPGATGLDGLQKIRRAANIPLVAIGGRNAGNAGDAVRSGADGIAVVSAIMAARDPEASARELLSAIRRGSTG